MINRKGVFKTLGVLALLSTGLAWYMGKDLAMIFGLIGFVSSLTQIR